jgi:hypothetical protein
LNFPFLSPLLWFARCPDLRREMQGPAKQSGGGRGMGGKMKTKSFLWLFSMVTLCFCSSPIYACMVHPYISGVSTATLLSEGEYEGWYLYKVSFEWNLGRRGAGLNHWDLILKENFAEEDHLIRFDAPAGLSTSKRFPCDTDAMGWTGYFNRKGDRSINLKKPVVGYDGPHFSKWPVAGPIGHGEFWFYSNIIPEYGTYDNVLVARAGICHKIFGDLSGAYPSCTVVPEPVTVLLLGLGSSMLFIRKR